MEANYRLVVKRNGKYTKMGVENCHDAKSIAGAMFKADKAVQSVYAGDITGKPFLYLVKGDPSKTINVPSETATL